MLHSTLCSPGPHNPLHRISWRNQDFHTSDQALFVFSAHNDNPLLCPWSKLLLILQRPLVPPPSCGLPWLSQILLVVPTSASTVLGVDIQTCADCIILCWIWFCVAFFIHRLWALWGLTSQTYSPLSPAQGLVHGQSEVHIALNWRSGDSQEIRCHLQNLKMLSDLLQAPTQKYNCAMNRDFNYLLSLV